MKPSINGSFTFLLSLSSDFCSFETHSEMLLGIEFERELLRLYPSFISIIP